MRPGAIMIIMPGQLLPLFPLQAVLFPRTFLPLHIFENRYKAMFAEVRAGSGEFGVVQASEKGIVNSGCTASIERVVKEYPDGRIDILTVGRRRFELIELDDEKPYLRGQVEYFDDDQELGAPDELIRQAIAGYEVLRNASEAQVIGEPQPDDPQLSWQVAQLVSDLDFRQTLLGTRSETERLKRFTEFVPGFIVRQKHTARIKELAPRNGHAKVKIQ
jgi:Lon protease-like protein